MMQRIQYRLSYEWKRVVKFFGVCPKCGNSLNYTSSGRGICPEGCR
jgi:hypothetical protein